MPDFRNHRIARFIVVGGLNTLFGFIVYSLLALTPLSTWLVLIVANVITITFNFFTTGGIVFRDLSLSRIPRFILVYGVIFISYLELIQWLSPIAGGRIRAMAFIVLPMAALTYLAQAIFVFGGRANKIGG